MQESTCVWSPSPSGVAAAERHLAASNMGIWSAEASRGVAVHASTSARSSESALLLSATLSSLSSLVSSLFLVSERSRRWRGWSRLSASSGPGEGGSSRRAPAQEKRKR
eukprot:scaffold133906_cov49-Tisochrysis_lutea.AAC.1